MASLFGDIFSALTNQQPISQGNLLSPTQSYADALAGMQSNLPALNSYNNALALGNANAQLGYENAINPYANDVRTGAYKSVLDNLNLGTSLSPALTADITRKLSETGAASGFGYSPAGIGNIALQTGLEANALGRQRQQDALQAANGLALTGAGFSPTQGPSPIAQQQQELQYNNAQNNLANLQEQQRSDNFSALLNTGTRILGGITGAVAGGFMGNPAGGAATGMAAGGVFFPGSQGRGQTSGGGLGFLNGLGSIGGPQYGIGAGRGYADANGNFQSSVLAQGVSA